MTQPIDSHVHLWVRGHGNSASGTANVRLFGQVTIARAGTHIRLERSPVSIQRATSYPYPRRPPARWRGPSLEGLRA